MKQILVTVALFMVFGLYPVSGFGQGLPTYEALKSDVSMTPKFMAFYRNEVRGCKRSFSKLESALSFSSDDSVILERMAELKNCSDKIDSALRVISDIVVGIYNVNQVPQEAAKSGWTEMQLKESVGWKKLIPKIMDYLEGVQEDNPWIQESSFLLEKAMKSKETRLVLYISRAHFLY